METIVHCPPTMLILVPSSVCETLINALKTCALLLVVMANLTV